ncbi:MAG TPA: aldose 1-epimerase family protein [Flavisolibacter sp.]|nr:aldose 1-epimerase family protein [Flavisolibacter sp.]
MFHLENDKLKVAIDSKGAELKSVVHKGHGLEYMWGADPAFWAKTSPVLFPIVGQLKDNTYRHNGNSYQLPRHGFARDKEFMVVKQDDHHILFSLQCNDETLPVYPFEFTFYVAYLLEGDELSVTYRVQNTGGTDMFFSVGGHPAFRVPLANGTAYADYRLRFNKTETAGRWPITAGGQIGAAPAPFLRNTDVLPLAKSLFEKDAIVLKHLQSDEVRLESDKTPHGLRFSFTGFPYLGLWAAPGADFVCIEPWCGIADSTDADGELAHKEGINKLAPTETFSATWKVQFY